MKISITIICCIGLFTLINADATIWKAVDVLNTNKDLDIGRYAVLVLDRPINLPQDVVVNIFNKASYRAAGDGGADRWYDFVSTVKPPSRLSNSNPDLIVGELYEIKNSTLQKAKENNVKIVDNHDQDKTDSVRGCEEISKQTGGKIDSVIIIAENSGRLDHIFANLNTLYKNVFGSKPIRLYILSTESLTWALKPGSHQIQVPQSIVKSQARCGLLPLGAPATVTTTGLKWNLDKGKMEFGGLVSTSNTYSKTTNGIITVETDSPLLWTMELK